MGNMHAQEWASMGGDMALQAHLVGNHYPPLPLTMLPIAKETIQRLADDEDATHHVTLPDGVSWKGQSSAPLYALAEHMHLDVFVAAEIERQDAEADDIMCIRLVVISE